MKHKYNNWSCKIFEGFYESNLYNSDSLYWITKNDIDEGYIQNNQYYDIDNWEQFTKDIAKQAVYKLLDILPNNDIIQDMELKDIYSPKYYNYETDSLIIDIKLNLTKLKKYYTKNKLKKKIKAEISLYHIFVRVKVLQ